MTKWFLLAFILILASVSLATEVIVTPINDTYVCNNCGSPNIHNDSPSALHGNSTFLVFDTDGGAASLQNFIKINFTQYQTRIIKAAYFRATNIVNGSCAAGTNNIEFMNVDNWADQITFAQRPIPSLRKNLSTYNAIGNQNQALNSTQFNISIPEFIADLYDDSITSFYIEGISTGGCSVVNTSITVDSIEGSTPETFRFDLVDFQNATVLGTDVTFVFFDFESGTASTTGFSGADFSYDVVNNIFQPLRPAVVTGSALSLTAANNLQLLDCASYAPFSFNQFSNLNVPSGTYDVICFDLSSEHNGHQFYGAIKLINNTNVRNGANPEADFHYALYSSELTTISNFTFSPDPPQGSRNLTVSWTSSQPTTSILRFRFRTLPNGLFTAYSTIFGDQNFTTSHSVIINKQFMLYPAAYEMFAQGTTSGNVTFNGATQTFSTSAFQEEISDIKTGINILVTDESNVPIRAFVSIDGLAPVQTHQVNVNTSQFGFVEVASFQGFGTGAHNFSVTKEGRGSQNFSIAVVSEPVFRTVKLLPEFACIKVGTFSTNTSCVQNGASGSIQHDFPALNVTSFYCQFDSSLCFTFDANGTCVQHPLGGWNQFACLDGFHPAGFAINGTVTIGQGPTDQVALGNIVDAVAGTFGISGQSLLAFLAITVSITVGFLGGIYTKNPQAVVIGFVGMLLAFTIVQWLEWWMLGILALIAAGVFAFGMQKVTTGA